MRTHAMYGMWGRDGGQLCGSELPPWLTKLGQRKREHCYCGKSCVGPPPWYFTVLYSQEGGFLNSLVPHLNHRIQRMISMTVLSAFPRMVHNLYHSRCTGEKSNRYMQWMARGVKALEPS